MKNKENINVQFENWAVNHGLRHENENGDKISKGLSVDSLIDGKHWIIELYKTGNQELDQDGLEVYGEWLKYSDITDKHGNLDENLAAEYVIYNINEFEPQMALNNFKEMGITSSYTNETFEDMLNKSKDFFDEKQLELEDEYNLSMEFDGPSMKI